MLLTRSPLGHPPEGRASLDLHVLSTPPAFVLSQDQTLREGIYDITSTILGMARIVDTESRCLGDSFNHWSKRADFISLRDEHSETVPCSICTKGISSRP